MVNILEKMEWPVSVEQIFAHWLFDRRRKEKDSSKSIMNCL